MNPDKALSILKTIDGESINLFLSELAVGWKPIIDQLVFEYIYNDALTQLCLVALENENLELYQLLILAGILPYEMDIDTVIDEETHLWVKCMELLLSRKNVQFSAVSLRFFRTDVRESMWVNHIDQMISWLTEITSIRVIGSIIRVVYNLSPADVLHLKLYDILEKVWTAAQETGDSRLYALLLEALLSEGPGPFKDRSVWIENTIRNLVSETLANALKGQFNEMSPTSTFCKCFRSPDFNELKDRIGMIKFEE